MQSLPAAVYVCDMQGRVKLFNEAAAELWGRRPVVFHDLWCGSLRIHHLDGTPLPLENCPMAATLHKQAQYQRIRDSDRTPRRLAPERVISRQLAAFSAFSSPGAGSSEGRSSETCPHPVLQPGNDCQAA